MGPRFRKLTSLVLAVFVAFSMFVVGTGEASAASGYNKVSKVKITEYMVTENGYEKVTSTMRFKYNKKNELIKKEYTKNDYIKYKYKYKKNGKKKGMTIIGGSWDGTKVYFNNKGQMYKYGDAKLYYNSKGYVSKIKHKTPWDIDGRYRETWKYTYNGSKLKTATHKVMKKNGKVLETDSYTFNSQGLPTKWISAREGDIPEETIYSYTYKNNRVKTVTKKSHFVDSESGPKFEQKLSFAYNTKKKISASKYRMMVFDIIRLNEDYYNFGLPGSWY